MTEGQQTPAMRTLVHLARVEGSMQKAVVSRSLVVQELDWQSLLQRPMEAVR